MTMEYSWIHDDDVIKIDLALRELWPFDTSYEEAAPKDDKFLAVSMCGQATLRPDISFAQLAELLALTVWKNCNDTKAGVIKVEINEGRNSDLLFQFGYRFDIDQDLPRMLKREKAGGNGNKE